VTALKLVVACGEEEARRLGPVLEAAGFSATRLAPGEADARRVEALGARLLILEVGPSEPLERILSFWEGKEMESHLPILLLHPPGPTPLPPGPFDEPVDYAVSPADPREVVARVQGLILAKRIRCYRRAFHDLSQPVTIALAVSRRALKLAGSADAVYPSLIELDRQVERIFRIAEDLQRKRAE